MNKGICVGGNIILDIIYPIESYPKMGELTTILNGIQRCPGGAVCNVAMDLARLDEKLPLIALGIIGDDEEGKIVVDEMKRYPNIDLSYIGRNPDLKTSFTAVMHDVSNHQRTFFQHRGANAKFDETCFPWEKIHPKILHMGYILLLDGLDKTDEKYGTKMAKLLYQAQVKGIKTSIDIVSEASDRFEKIVAPALKYTDYCIINEIEAQKTTGILLRDEHQNFIHDAIPHVLERLIKMGVSEWAIIHAPEGGYGLSKGGIYEEVPSLKLPSGYIKGTVGAGDAFCAGVLYGAYQENSLKDALVLGAASAACSLASESATEGVKKVSETMAFYDESL